tara:strand:+ start:113 stop:559 length:447 start_codon:yes stop_codon:yes gene_type:complete
MKLDFCVLCGTTENLHHHHVIPKAQGGTDDEDNFITLCYDHHAMIHSISPSKFNQMQVLAAIGRESAMKRGVKFGKKPQYEHFYPQIIKMYCEEWKGYGTIAKELGTGISRQGVRSIVKRLDIKNKRNPKTLFKTYKQNKRTGQYKLF